MRTTLTVDLQLPLRPTAPILHVFGGMWQHEHQGMLMPHVGGLAHALSSTDVGFVAPVAPTNGSMWTDWRNPTLISDKNLSSGKRSSPKNSPTTCGAPSVFPHVPVTP
ncbi:hypothetical protein [Lawsonella clevelandensis]|uniref:hypothetical protein n=1 Tax=Lawsonella clevelandensis TaxID=1528099 RepID=UPI001F28EA8F|nr:hypothetical protein [Lawsonella clevelandensis]